MPNPYQPLETEVLRVIDETPTIKTLELRPTTPIEFRAGQFMQLYLPGVGEAPFTPSSSPSQREKMEITILKTGYVTEKLHQTEEGSTVGLRGPFGKGYPVEKLEGQEILVVGGGVGLAPLRSLLFYLFENAEKYKRISIKYGAREPAELVYRRMYDDWSQIPNVDFTPAIDRPADGWTGRVGLVTTLLEDVDLDRENGTVFSCGPSIMLRFVTQKLLDIGYRPQQIYLSMNRRMSCGTGKCGRCSIGPYFLCKDGPDMNYEKIKDFPNVFA